MIFIWLENWNGQNLHWYRLHEKLTSQMVKYATHLYKTSNFVNCKVQGPLAWKLILQMAKYMAHLHEFDSTNYAIKYRAHFHEKLWMVKYRAHLHGNRFCDRWSTPSTFLVSGTKTSKNSGTCVTLLTKPILVGPCALLEPQKQNLLLEWLYWKCYFNYFWPGLYGQSVLYIYEWTHFRKLSSMHGCLGFKLILGSAH